MAKVWKYRSRSRGFEVEEELSAYWEVSWDPMSDSFVPSEIDAVGLLRRWAKKVREKYPDLLIPIYWYVIGGSNHAFENMPFQYEHHPKERDFLTYFTWPTDPETGERLNWVTLPVMDKLWGDGHVDKGGFIQSATGWKPSIYQPHVYLPTLIDTR